MRGFSPCQGRFSPGSLFGHSSSPCCQRCIVENAPISNSKTKLHVDTAYHVRTGKYQIEHSSKFGVAGLPSLYSFACLPALIPPEQQSNKNVRNGTLFAVSSRWVAYSVSVLACFFNDAATHQELHLVHGSFEEGEPRPAGSKSCRSGVFGLGKGTFLCVVLRLWGARGGGGRARAT